MAKKVNIKKQKVTKKPPTIKEARRYVDNAYEVLNERGQLDEDGIAYQDEFTKIKPRRYRRRRASARR